jgi:predicted DCC family thiol-disulfide oxidoreductase YuxK
VTARAGGNGFLVFDGACGFCTRVARWVERRVPPGTRVVPWHRVRDLSRCGLTEEEAASAAWWIDAEGRRHRGHLAVAEALRAIGGGWRPVGAAIRVPPIRWLAAGVYELVARIRGHLPGTTPTVRDR